MEFGTPKSVRSKGMLEVEALNPPALKRHIIDMVGHMLPGKQQT